MMMFKNCTYWALVVILIATLVACVLDVKKTYYHDGKIKSKAVHVEPKRLIDTSYMGNKKQDGGHECLYWLDSPSDCAV